VLKKKYKDIIYASAAVVGGGIFVVFIVIIKLSFSFHPFY